MTLPAPITTSQLLLRFEDVSSGFVDLTEQDLTQVDFAAENVRECFRKIVELHHPKSSHPVYVNFERSDVSGANFSYYNLSNAIMSRVKAVGTLFMGANLSDANLEGANLERADFRRATLKYTKLYETNIVGVNFSEADLQTVYGLSFGSHEHALERLKDVASLKNALVPMDAEKICDYIQKTIELEKGLKPAKASFSRRSSVNEGHVDEANISSDLSNYTLKDKLSDSMKDIFRFLFQMAKEYLPLLRKFLVWLLGSIARVFKMLEESLKEEQKNTATDTKLIEVKPENLSTTNSDSPVSEFDKKINTVVSGNSEAPAKKRPKKAKVSDI